MRHLGVCGACVTIRGWNHTEELQSNETENPKDRLVLVCYEETRRIFPWQTRDPSADESEHNY